MTRNVLLMLFAVLPLAAIGAGGSVAHPLLQVGKVWNYDYSYVVVNYEDGSNERIHGSCTYRVEKDTIVGDRCFYWVSATYSDRENVFRSLWHEEDGRVYHCGNVAGQGALTYDFSLSAGDFIPAEDIPNAVFHGLEVLSADTVLVRGLIRKRMHVREIGTIGVEAAWVEGIGNPGNLAEPIYHLVSDGREYSLISCYLGDECLFTSEDFDAEPYHAGNAGIAGLYFNGTPYFSATFDLQGRRVSGTPRPGIYIRNGRKVVNSRRVDK